MQTKVKETTLACPRCSRCLMVATILHSKVLPTSEDKTYISLRCISCLNELQFEVNLSPEIEHNATGASSV